ncbi:hypothetical protein HMPREF1870_00750, partial [Bacteroidales bacterium KA00344]
MSKDSAKIRVMQIISLQTIVFINLCRVQQQMQVYGKFSKNLY